MNQPLRDGERQLRTARSEGIPTLAYAAIGGALAGVTLLLWAHFGFWTLLLAACVFGAAGLAKLFARFELKRMLRELEYQRRTPYEAGVGQQLGQSVDVEA